MVRGDSVIEPGTPAPDFSLPDQDGNPVALSDFKGRKLVLAFYPLDFSPVCTDQLSIYQEVVGQIEEQGATLVGVSVDSAFSHKAFREHLNLTIPLLADFNPKGEVARAYGSYIDKAGIANRNLVLTEGASAESIPNLEIEADDVRCSHASTVGPIDDEQLYYLESRGVPPEEAERLIVLGFFDDVLDRLPVSALTRGLRRSVIDKLEHRGAQRGRS